MKWYKTLAVTFFAACLGGTAQAGRDSSTIEQTLNALSQQITALKQDNQALQTQINQLQPSTPKDLALEVDLYVNPNGAYNNEIINFTQPLENFSSIRLEFYSDYLSMGNGPIFDGITSVTSSVAAALDKKRIIHMQTPNTSGPETATAGLIEISNINALVIQGGVGDYANHLKLIRVVGCL